MAGGGSSGISFWTSDAMRSRNRRHPAAPTLLGQKTVPARRTATAASGSAVGSERTAMLQLIRPTRMT